MGTLHQHRNTQSNSSVKNWYVCRNGALTVTVGLCPNVRHAAVEQINQHQSIAVQECVLAAFVARTSLEKQSHFIAYLTGYCCFHEHCKKDKQSKSYFPKFRQHHEVRDHETQNEAWATQEGWRPLKHKTTCLFSPYLVWDVHINVHEAAVSGETVLTNFNGSRSGYKAVDRGGIPLSENAKQITAVYTDLRVFR